MKYHIAVSRRKRAYTLIELMLAMALFIALAGVMGYAILRAVRAHDFETSYREAALQARSVLTQMVEELRVARVPVDTSDLGKGIGIASVLWSPDPYGSENNPFGSIYDLRRKENGYRGYNRMIFSRPDPNNAGRFVFVDWFVPSNHRDRIYRVAHYANANEGRGQSVMPDYIYKVVGSSSNAKYVFKDPRGVFGDGTGLGSYLAYTSGNVADYTVAMLPHEYDTFCFAVELEPNTSEYSAAQFGTITPEPNEDNALYSVKLAKITLKATVHAKADQERAEDDGDPYEDEIKSDNRGAGQKRSIVVHEQAYLSR